MPVNISGNTCDKKSQEVVRKCDFENFKSCASAISPHRHWIIKFHSALVLPLHPGFVSRAVKNYKTKLQFANQMTGSFSNLRNQMANPDMALHCVKSKTS